MTGERWILLGVTDPHLEKTVRKVILEEGYRTTRVKGYQECANLIARRTFLCAFLEPALLRRVIRSCPFRTPTYTVLVTQGKTASKAIILQKEEKIHDWIIPSDDLYKIKSIILRARSFLRMAGELDSIKSQTAQEIARDVTLVCNGHWEKKANTWLSKFKNNQNPVLFTGEIGSGKRLLARFLHYSSSRANAPFIVVSCSSNEGNDVERKIFGEIPPRNGFLRSYPCRSAFSLAANGTVVFDKVEKLPKRIQQRLAKAITTQTFSPIGGGDRMKLEARLVLTVQEKENQKPVLKTLQRDLARSLKRSVLRIPSLRERTKDLPNIVQSILKKLRDNDAIKTPGCTGLAMELIETYSWPGNIRELEGTLRAASILAGQSKISMRTLTPFIQNGLDPVKDEERSLEELIQERLSNLFGRFDMSHLKNLHPMVIERVEKPLFSLALEQTKGNQVRAAQLLGINRNTLRRKLTHYGIR